MIWLVLASTLTQHWSSGLLTFPGAAAKTDAKKQATNVKKVVQKSIFPKVSNHAGEHHRMREGLVNRSRDQTPQLSSAPAHRVLSSCSLYYNIIYRKSRIFRV